MGKGVRDAFLQLVRLGIGHGAVNGSWLTVNGSIDWQGVQDLAAEQGLSAVVLDGIEELRTKNLELRVPQVLLLEWIGEVQISYEYQYKLYKEAIAELAGWHNAHGFKMMVLKGYACSLDWPRPEHRPCGDIDIWQFGRQKEADAALGSWFMVQGSNQEIDRSHHHHTVYEWQGFAVENHYDFVNVYQNRTNAKVEKIFKELGTYKVESGEFSVESQLKGCSVEGCKIPCVEVNGERVYLPSANLHALFLLKHAALHFVNTELTFRQVLDWAFFVEKHGRDVDWDWLLPIIEEHGMTPFLGIINAICVEELGFDKTLFPTATCDSSIKDKVVNEIFASVYEDKEPDNIFLRQISRFRRWKGNAWKHKLCYKESMWSVFWSSVWGHLLKPGSI